MLVSENKNHLISQLSAPLPQPDTAPRIQQMLTKCRVKTEPVREKQNVGGQKMLILARGSGVV